MTASLQDLLMLRQKDIETRFAACLMINPSQTVQECGWLAPEVILDEKVRKFWTVAKSRVMPGMFDTGSHDEITKISMETGIIGDLLEPMRDLPSSMVPLAYAREIARRAYIVNQTDNTQKLIQALRLSDDDAARKIIRQMADQDIKESVNAPTAYDVASLFQSVVETGARSVKFNIIPLDNATGGMERQTLTILAARPSVGKTALGWQIAQSAAYSGKTAMFFSLEMSSVNLWGRAACPKIGTTWRDVRAGKLSQDQKDRLNEEQYALALQFESRLKIIDTPQTTETIWRAVVDHRPDLVIVDHLRLVKDVNISEVKRLGEISQRLKEIGKNFNCAVLLLAQLNRQSEMRQEKRPILADLRDSGEIEENGDLILMLHRDEPQTEKKPDKSITEVWVRKFRDGPRDVLIKLLFDPRQEWFEELPR
jgi:replicative DNA helicase